MKAKKCLLIILMVLAPAIYAIAEGPGGPGSGPDGNGTPVGNGGVPVGESAPIGSGLAFMLLFSAAYGAKKLYHTGRSKIKNQQINI